MGRREHEAIVDVRETMSLLALLAASNPIPVSDRQEHASQRLQSTAQIRTSC